MKQVKLVNGLLWGLNILLGVAIVIFAFNFLLFPKAQDPLNLDFGEDVIAKGPGNTGNFAVLHMLSNPVIKGTTGGPVTDSRPAEFQNVTLIGTWYPTAFIRVGARETQAEIGQPIMFDGVEMQEVRGWKLIAVEADSATFSDGTRQTTLKKSGGESLTAMDTTNPTKKRSDLVGKEYDGSQYKSKLVEDTATRKVYEMDPEEIAWAQANFDQILGNDFTFDPTGSGGLRVTEVRQGSIGAFRGVQQNDVIKSVNQVEIKGIADLKNLKDNKSKSRTLTVVVERDGQNVQFVYQPIKKEGGR